MKVVLQLQTVDHDRAEFRARFQAEVCADVGELAGLPRYGTADPQRPWIAVLTSIPRPEWEKAGGPLTVEVDVPDGAGE